MGAGRLLFPLGPGPGRPVGVRKRGPAVVPATSMCVRCHELATVRAAGAVLDENRVAVLAYDRLGGGRTGLSDAKMTDLIIDLGTLKPSMDRVEVDVPARDAGLPDADWRGDIHCSLRVERSGDRVSVRGTVSSPVHLECVRCLRDFVQVVTASLTVFAERSEKSHRAEENELQRDHIMLFHDGRRLDLRETVREELLLELPITPYCREDCPGLCLKCGADLNLGPCGCML